MLLLWGCAVGERVVLEVDGARDGGLARAGFAGEQGGDLALGDALEEGEDLAHGLAFAHEGAGFVAKVDGDRACVCGGV